MAYISKKNFFNFKKSILTYNDKLQYFLSIYPQNITSFGLLIHYQTIAIIILILFVLIHIYFFFESTELVDNSTRTLNVDGFCCFHAKNREDEQNISLKELPPNYEFLDYEYTIYSTALSTFHRDVTSSQVIYNCKYPVYTLIVYEYGGDLLSICPASERTWPFVWSRIVNLNGSPGTCILFNSELLHAGQPNECLPRLTRQYKICHIDDIQKLSHLHEIRAKKNIECMDDLLSKIKRKMSYYFAFSINHILYPFLMQKWQDDTWMGKLQTLLPDHQFYNNV